MSHTRSSRIRGFGRMSRRSALKGAVISCSTCALGTSFLASWVKASEPSMNDNELYFSVLTKALRATGNAACVREADRLQASPKLMSYFNLHLRQAGLNVRDAVIIAEGMREASNRFNGSMQSFSVSYNHGLEDEGVIALANSFPPTLTEVGLVDCGIGDEGGNALFNWAQGAVALRMICLERNNLSQGMRDRFYALGEKRKDLFIVV